MKDVHELPKDIKEFLTREACVCGGHWLVAQHQSGGHNTTILQDGNTLCFAWTL